jgi:hypothetical protein
MLVDWIKELLLLLGLNSSDFESITLFNFTISLESICLLVFVVWLILLIVVLIKKFHKLI